MTDASPWQPVVVLGREGGRVGIFCDPEDGTLYLGEVGEHGATGIRIEGYRPAILGLPGEDWLVGGVSPPGATEAEIFDQSGDGHVAFVAEGHWVACITQQMFAAVVFRDDEGRVVARPQAPGLRREDVPDADEKCPACSGTQWELIRRDSHGDWDDDDSLVCTRCGHEEAIGTFTWTDHDQEDAAEEEYDDEEPWPVEADDAALIRAAPFPLFALGSSWTGSRWLAGLAFKPDRAEAVALGHGLRDERHSGPWVTVETRPVEDHKPPAESRARQALATVFANETGPWPEISEAALSLWLDTRHREHNQRANRAPLSTTVIRVDGQEVPFTVVGDPAVWAAVGTASEMRITVVALGLAPEGLELAAVQDVEVYLEAR